MVRSALPSSGKGDSITAINCPQLSLGAGVRGPLLRFVRVSLLRSLRISRPTVFEQVENPEDEALLRRAETLNSLRVAHRPAQQKKSIGDDAIQLKLLDPMIGDLDLRQVHMGSLQPFIAKRKAEGVKTKTLNAALAVVRRILNLAASEWIDENGLTGLETTPKIKLFPVEDSRSPYPLTQEEQSLLFQELPDHLACLALYKVNTRCREQELCCLRWEYEVKVPELDTCVFIIPSSHVKNGEERLVVLNRVAKSLVDSMRGLHPTHVFVRVPSKGEPRPIPKM